MKKYLLILPVLLLSAFLLMGADIAHAQSSAYSAGDLIKTVDRSTVYYFGFDGKRHSFPNEPTYFSWYSNFDGIKIVTAQELASIALGHNIVVRPGTHLVKIESDPRVYAVEPYGVLRHIPSEETARKLYGHNWGSKVLDVSVVFFPDYTIREALASNPSVHPEGTVFRYLGNNVTYIYRGGVAIPFRDLTQAEAHRYQDRFIINLARNGQAAEDGRLHAALVQTGLTSMFNYPVNGDEITNIHPVLIDVAQTLVNAVLEVTPSGENVTNNYYTYYTGGSCSACPECPSLTCSTCETCESCECDTCDTCDDEGEELKPIFKVDDRVKYLGSDPNFPEQANDKLAFREIGTISEIEISETHITYLVIFDNYIESKLTPERDPSQGYGAWVREKYLELFKEQKNYKEVCGEQGCYFKEDEKKEYPEKEKEQPSDDPLPKLTFGVGDKVWYSGGYPENQDSRLFSESLAMVSLGKILEIQPSQTLSYKDALCLVQFGHKIASSESKDAAQDYTAWIPIAYLYLDNGQFGQGGEYSYDPNQYVYKSIQYNEPQKDGPVPRIIYSSYSEKLPYDGPYPKIKPADGPRLKM